MSRKQTTYFIQEEGGGPVKIGHAGDGNFNRRASELQTGNPRKLHVIGGTCVPEREVHKKFAGLKILGEWYQPWHGLIDWIKDSAWRIKVTPPITGPDCQHFFRDWGSENEEEVTLVTRKGWSDIVNSTPPSHRRSSKDCVMWDWDDGLYGSPRFITVAYTRWYFKSDLEWLHSACINRAQNFANYRPSFKVL